MKTFLSHILTFLICSMAVISCNDELVDEGNYGLQYHSLRIQLAVPGGTAMRAAGSYVDQDQSSDYPGNLDEQTAEQRIVGDINVLQFTDGKFVRLVDVETTGNEPGSAYLTLKGKVPANESGMSKFVILANLSDQGVSLAPALFTGATEKQIYEQLVYQAPENSWNLSERTLPMWGETMSVNVSAQSADIALSGNLYRSVAKMGVQVDPLCTNFKMTDIYVYYTNTAGYCASPNHKPNPSLNIQYTLPDIPVCKQRTDETPYHYDILATPEDADHKYVSHSEGHPQLFLNQIYVPEADNTHLGPGEKAVKVVVGGYNADNLAKRYYLIDLKDNQGLAPGSPEQPYNLIRNHSYIFNIKKVMGDGADTPEDALPLLSVTIDDWTDVYMRGVPDQYTLAVDKSFIHYTSHRDLTPQRLKITTDLGEGWTIEKNPNLLDPADPKSDQNDWYTLSQTVGPSGETFITVTPKTANTELEKTGSFFVVAGNIRKEITLKQPQPRTGNCYMLGDEKDFSFVISIKGNGREGVFAEGGVPLIPGFTKENPPTEQQIRDFLTIKPAYIGIIWETTPGMISLKDPTTNTYIHGDASATVAASAEMPRLDMNGRTVLTVRASFNPSSKAELMGHTGGNALVGAFDAKDNVLWTWHLWVCPDFIDEGTQIVKPEHIENWTYNDYDFMDRNIGALSSRPDAAGEFGAGLPANSIASQGLLFQWGRKEPFIGANYCTDKSPKNDNNGNPGLQNVIHYYTNKQTGTKNWGRLQTQFTTDAALSQALANPTSLIHSGKKREGLITIPNLGQSLWGISDALFSKTKDLGNKTIYDPSPVGFRVPPVDAFVYHGQYKLKSSGGDRYEPDPNEPIETFELARGQEKKYGYPVYYQIFGWSEWTLAENGKVKNSSRSTRTYRVQKARLVSSGGFKTVEHSSEDKNFRFNLMYVPHYTTREYASGVPTGAIQWGDYFTQKLLNGEYTSEKTADDRAKYVYYGGYVKNAPYYGFYMCYDDLYHEPTLANEVTKKGTIINSRSSSETKDYYMKLSPSELNRTAWFPITAVYDPVGSKKVSLEKVLIQTGYSVTVNSFLWTNSTARKEYGQAPAAMFLHGTENPGINDGESHHLASGRHIHWLKDSKIEAEAQFAGSVRCVRDREKTQWFENSLTKEVNIKPSEGAQTTINIVSVNSAWRLVAPGAPWLKVSPDAGTATKGNVQTITLEVIKPANGVIPPEGTQTKLEFQILNETETRIVTVTLKK